MFSWSTSSRAYISAKIHSKCASQPKIAKKSLKTHIFEVQGRSRSSMLVPPESSSAVLVMIRSKSVSICNHSRARLVDSNRNRTFSRGYQNLLRSYGGLLETRGWKLALLKSTFNAENFIRDCDIAQFRCDGEAFLFKLIPLAYSPSSQQATTEKNKKDDKS